MASAFDSGTGVDRRSAIKKALIASGVGYVAPMILASATPAAAQAISGVCPGTDTCLTFSCGGGACACVPTVSASIACVAPICTAVPCTTNAQCGGGSVCFTLGCCGVGSFCVPLCGGPGPVPGQPGQNWAH